MQEMRWPLTELGSVFVVYIPAGVIVDCAFVSDGLTGTLP